MTAGDPPKKLLVIEDNPGDQRLIAIKLAEAQVPWKADLCGSLGEGLRLAAGTQYECILADLGLPDASGLESVIRMKAQSPATALVVLTGLDDERVAQDAIRAGAQDYVVKSLAGLELLPRVIRHAIERQQAQVQLELSHHTTQALLDASHDMALLLDADGRIITLNVQAAEQLGHRTEELGGENLFAIERKSIADLVGCCVGENRERFFRELHRLRGFRFKRLLVIGGRADIDGRDGGRRAYRRRPQTRCSP